MVAINDGPNKNTITRDNTKFTLLIMGYFGLASYKDFSTRQEAEETGRKFHDLCASDGCPVDWDNIRILPPGCNSWYAWDRLETIKI